LSYYKKMNISSEASKIVTNKYFLYFMLFLAVTNLLGYLVTHKFNAIIFFVLVAVLTHQFSKNMAVVALVAVVATNFLMANKYLREGLENNTTTTTESEESTDDDDNDNNDKGLVNNDSTLGKIGAIDPQLHNEMKKLTPKKATPAEASTNTKAYNDKTADATPVNNNQIDDPNNPGQNKTKSNGGVSEPFGMGSNNKKQASKETRLDYAATVEESYANLDKILGSSNIKQLSSDTQNLMKKQTELFKTMNSMIPVLEGAQNMVKSLNVEGLIGTLGTLKQK
jgi:hypothetical protein